MFCLIRLRNSSPAFAGDLSVADTEDQRLQLTWRNGNETATLTANLAACIFEIVVRDARHGERRLAFS